MMDRRTFLRRFGIGAAVTAVAPAAVVAVGKPKPDGLQAFIDAGVMTTPPGQGWWRPQRIRTNLNISPEILEDIRIHREVVAVEMRRVGAKLRQRIEDDILGGMP